MITQPEALANILIEVVQRLLKKTAAGALGAAMMGYFN